MKSLIILILVFMILALLYSIRGLLDYLEDLLGHTPDTETVRKYIKKAKLKR